MPRTKEQNTVIRAEKKKLIMNSALELFAEDGYAHTSIDKIAKHADISKGLLYTYFKSKDDLLYQILFSGVKKLSEGLFQNEMTAESFIESFEKAFDRMMENEDFFKLYTALSTQPGIMQKMSGALINEHIGLHNVIHLFRKHFGDRADSELLILSVIAKGYSMLALFGGRQTAVPTDLLKKTILDFVRERYNFSK